jgi:hypothetical protein
VDALIERRVASAKRFRGHGRSDIGELAELLRFAYGDGAISGHHLRAVHQRQALLRGEAQRLESGLLERERGIHHGVPIEDLPLADERQHEMRERREVPAGADGTARRDDRNDPRVVDLREEFGGLDADAREALCKRVQPEDEHRADDLDRERVADAGGMALDEIFLKLLDVLGADADIAELAEARRHAVDRLSALHPLFDDPAGRVHSLLCSGGKGDGNLAERALIHLFDREGIAVENEGFHAVECRKVFRIYKEGV